MAGGGLATARLSYQAQRLPCVQAEAHPVYRLHHTGATEARVVDFQILYLQQWWHCRLLVLRPGAAPGYCVGLLTPASLAGDSREPISRAQYPPVWRGALFLLH